MEGGLKAHWKPFFLLKKDTPDPSNLNFTKKNWRKLKQVQTQKSLNLKTVYSSFTSWIFFSTSVVKQTKLILKHLQTFQNCHAIITKLRLTIRSLNSDIITELPPSGKSPNILCMSFESSYYFCFCLKWNFEKHVERKQKKATS